MSKSSSSNRMAHNSRTHLTFFSIFILMASATKIYAIAKSITLVNVCEEKIWPGIITHGDSYSGEGFTLKPGQSAFYTATNGWSGRIWARTGCNFNSTTSRCQTGSCGPSINCTGPGSLPVTIAEFTLGDEIDYYDVSLVDGFNVPVLIRPFNGKGNCSNAGCDGDLRQNNNCPSELAVKDDDGKVIGCRSACDKFNSDEYCCRGAYGDLTSCLPSNYSKSFKQVCPGASSYAFDDRTTIITCSATDYLVAFCASRNQSLCSYHDNKIFCNQSKGSKVLSQSWWQLPMILTLPLALNIKALL